MKKIIFTICFASLYANAQVGINTESPNATLEVAVNPQSLSLADGIIAPRLSGVQLLSKDNLYDQNQTATIVYVNEPLSNSSTKTVNVDKVGYYYFDGEVWQKFKGDVGSLDINANNGLTKNVNNIKLGGNLSEITTIGTSSVNTLRFTGLQSGNAIEDEILVVDADGTIKSVNNVTNELSIPSPAIFTLNADQNNFLNGVSAGNNSVVNMVLTKNAIKGLTYDQSTRTINFPTGIYQMTFVYEATHDATDCTISSYIIDFPTSTTSNQRIHSTAHHKQGGQSNHGGTVNYVTDLNVEKSWTIRLGRGQSGNCTGEGNLLKAQSTQLLIFRIGD